MKRTDFSKIANRYEKNRYRLDMKMDRDLHQFIQNYSRENIRVLDLACGTGIYLEYHVKQFQREKIEWHGLDASKDMLKKARSKLTNHRVTLIQGLAEKLPFPQNHFDFIVNNYAFHHFTEKATVLDETYRVLKPGGVFKIHNTAIHDMKKWWVYHYFPSAYNEDLKRYWPKEKLFQELSQRGSKVNLEIDYRMEQIQVADYLDYAENRDISVLTLISDDEYMEGIEKMQSILSLNPEARIINDFALLNVISLKL